MLLSAPASSPPREAAVIGPCSALVLRVCSSAGDSAARDDPAGDPILAIVADLVAGHREQWAAEDRSRASTTAAEKAAVKARIDALNSRRAELVAAVDAVVAARVPAPAPRVPLHTETVGSVIDRLVIAWVRAGRLVGDRGRRAGHQLRELADAYDVLLAEVASGARRVPNWAALKSYGPADDPATTPAEGARR